MEPSQPLEPDNIPSHVAKMVTVDPIPVCDTRVDPSEDMQSFIVTSQFRTRDGRTRRAGFLIDLENSVLDMNLYFKRMQELVAKIIDMLAEEGYD
jgi:hypothetical protein